MKELAGSLGVGEEPSEWPRVLTRARMYEAGGSALFRRYKGTRDLLQSLFPELSFPFAKTFALKIA